MFNEPINSLFNDPINSVFSTKRTRSDEEELKNKRSKHSENDTINQVATERFSMKRNRSYEDSDLKQSKFSKSEINHQIHDNNDLTNIFYINQSNKNINCDIEDLSKYLFKNDITLEEKKILNFILIKNLDSNVELMIDIIKVISQFQFLKQLDISIEALIFKFIKKLYSKYSSEPYKINQLNSNDLNSLFYSIWTLKDSFQITDNIEFNEFMNKIFTYIFTCHEFNFHKKYTPIIENIIEQISIDEDNVGKLIKYPSRTEACIEFIKENNDVNVEFNYNSTLFKNDTLTIEITDIDEVNVDQIKELTEYLDEMNIPHFIVLSIEQIISLKKLQEFNNSLKENEINLNIHLNLPAFELETLNNYLSIISCFKEQIFSFMYCYDQNNFDEQINEPMNEPVDIQLNEQIEEPNQQVDQPINEIEELDNGQIDEQDNGHVDEQIDTDLINFLDNFYKIDLSSQTSYIPNTNLHLHNPTNADRILNALLVKCTKISAIHILSPTLTQLPALNNFKNLNGLTLNSCIQFEKFSFDSFDIFSQLTHVSLKDTPIENLPSLNLNNLIYLNLKNCYLLQNITFTSKLNKIPTLNISGCDSLPIILKKQFYVLNEIGSKKLKADGLIQKLITLENHLINTNELDEVTKNLFLNLLKFYQGNLQKLTILELLLIAENLNQKISIIKALHDTINIKISFLEALHDKLEALQDKIDLEKDLQDKIALEKYLQDKIDLENTYNQGFNQNFNQIIASEIIPILKLSKPKNSQCSRLQQWNKLKLKIGLDLLANSYVGNQFNDSYWKFASVICHSIELLLNHKKNKDIILSFFAKEEQLILPLAPIFEKYTRDFANLIKSKFPNLNYYETKKYISYNTENFGYRSIL
ncbi:MAG: hypothetical protein Q8K60_03290 [Parachlamydiaceae bacterium]|nr:hypothetical protein [Parachlamydiaceae bacterium]